MKKDFKRQEELFDRHADDYEAESNRYVNRLWHDHRNRLCLDFLRAAIDTKRRTPVVVCDLCCGAGNGLKAFLDSGLSNGSTALGLDVSRHMLRKAVRNLPQASFCQTNVLELPLAAGSVSILMVIGGIHHVRHLETFLAECFRVLEPDGVLVFSEPLNDWVLWRSLRSIVYRLSPFLEKDEWPLRKKAFVQKAQSAGLRLEAWTEWGFAGHALTMESDILFFTRFADALPGIERLYRTTLRFDAWCLRLPFLQGCGLQVSGLLRKTAA